MANKKLIEVALPLEKINSESAREKSLRNGHPSTLHLWWARRPLAAARAVIWASLVDDPSAHPEHFPSEEEQNVERKRLFKILEDLVVWENSNEESVIKAAQEEIRKSTGEASLEFLDPFAGGGAIPLEAFRLGLKTHAHDLNPVAVTINKAMIEIPSRFSGLPPVHPGTLHDIGRDRVVGIAEDIEYYGNWIKEQAYKRIGSLYPKVRKGIVEGGDYCTVIGWIWTRTAKCPNPMCNKKIPLPGNYVLSKRKGNEAWVEPICDEDEVTFVVHKGKCPKGKETSKLSRSAIFQCPFCGETTTDEYIKSEGKKGAIGIKLMAIVGEGKRGREYFSPTVEHELAADIPRPLEHPTGKMPENPRWFSPPAFGMYDFSDLFTNRELLALLTFSDLIKEVGCLIEKDALAAGMDNNHISLNMGGTGARAYSEAIRVYLSFVLDRMADKYSSVCVWNNIGEKIEHTFGRQAIPMAWDFAEANPFSNSSGCYTNMLDFVVKSVAQLPANGEGKALQVAAQTGKMEKKVIVSTDPPYYDNIGYADLSDYFYIWMRNCIKDIYPELFATMMVPKNEELIATPYRHDGQMQKAKSFFEQGMLDTCCQIYEYAHDDYPVTIYYAYKQTDDTDNKGRAVSSGWETMLKAIIDAGFAITGTWPIRTERQGRLIGNGTNALASSIVLVCRKRNEEATQITRRNLTNILRRELRPALKNLQDSNIAPVDLAQSAIGPGMGVFSRYRRVLEADGSPMTVRSALQLINEEIDLYFNEQVGELDSASRFCVDLYTQNAYNDMKYGEAEVLANAKGVSIPMLVSHGILYAKAGNVHIIERTNLSEKISANESNIWLLTQQLTYAMEQGGIESCAKIVHLMLGSNAERAKDLAYRLYTISEQKKWANEAYAYNALVVAWPDIQSRAAAMKAVEPKQLTLFDMETNS